MSGARPIWTAIILGASFVVALAAAVLLVEWASVAPSASTAEIYAPLSERQRIRQDIRPAPTVPPLIQEQVRAGAEATPVDGSEETLFRAPASRIRIPSIDVNAAIVSLSILPSGQMETPDSADVVGWYEFTGKPGAGGNAVLSGHVDYWGHGPAVFWDLRQLEPGDMLEILLTDDTVLTYEVVSSLDAPVEELRMNAILAPTERESLTLITCSGTLSDGRYPNRLVVRAVRVTAAGE